MRPASLSARVAAFTWAVILLLCALFVGHQIWHGTPLDTRITALLPESHDQQILQHADASLGKTYERRLLVLVKGDDSAQAAEQLRAQLKSSGVVASLDSKTPPRPDQTLSDYRYRLLSAELQQADGDSWRKQALARLFTPGMETDLLRDPFGLLDQWLNERLSGPVSWLDGGPSIDSAEGRWRVISATLDGDPYQLALQTRLTETLDAFKAAHPQLTVLRAGVVFHAAAGAQQARSEISTIGLGSLLGIIVLLALVFRRVSVLVSLLLPVFSGLVLATAVSWALFESLNLITLAFGASLIGISVDYALHLQCYRQLHPQRSLSQLWPSLFLGLLTSLCAYLVQLATPMPGLRQMATFTALGLIGAWLTVRLWLPLLSIHPHPATSRIAERLNRWRLTRPRLPIVLAASLVLSTATLVAMISTTLSHDLRQLNPSPSGLITEQQHVQRLMQRPASFRYLVVRADTGEALLQRLEDIDPSLASLARDGHLDSWQHIAQAVPSQATQQRNLTLVRQRYQDVLPELLTQAGLDPSLSERLSQRLDDVPELTVSDWLSSRAGEGSRSLWLEDTDTPTALVLLGDIDTRGVAELQELAEAPDILYRDRVSALSNQLTILSKEISQWLLLAVVVVIAGLSWRYRQRAWRALLPPVGAVAVTLGLFAATHTGLTLFHLLGLLLVLGIGLDAGIFSTEHPADGSAWLAITLSCASSLLAFGLLAFSATPALHFLGTTCLIGLVATWCLVPLARGVQPHDPQHLGSQAIDSSETRSDETH
ncbi:MMPL family transporter [Halomonas huangheensis]|uniref:Membrane transport protein MMPL domain-containing protein n=1 Tax=Halomonas huangheensis TaxID=1178482 RepID=W1N259_9GAMM|nr:MMPL family transporter [Halomonas huangheensis]ERL49667.1 hypothetical protein BJB45_00685 [Halomonas huangheensis]